MIQQNLHNQRKICPSATLSTINPKCAGLESNPGLCSDRPVADYLIMSHGKAPNCCCKYFSVFFSVYLNYCDLGVEVQISAANMSFTPEPSGAEKFCDK
jgi:hypothetical protein